MPYTEYSVKSMYEVQSVSNLEFTEHHSSLDVLEREHDNDKTCNFSLYKFPRGGVFMKAKLAAILVGTGLLLAARPLGAHHSFAAEFDAAKPITLTGAVTKVEWTNPHAWFYIDVKDETGKVTNWGLEMGSPNGLMRAGWTRNSMKLSDVVTVEASRAKNGTNNANARVVILKSTGQRLFAASSQGQQP